MQPETEMFRRDICCLNRMRSGAKADIYLGRFVFSEALRKFNERAQTLSSCCCCGAASIASMPCNLFSSMLPKRAATLCLTVCSNCLHVCSAGSTSRMLFLCRLLSVDQSASGPAPSQQQTPYLHASICCVTLLVVCCHPMQPST